MNNSLMKILNDPSLLFDDERLKKTKEDVKKSQNSICKSADKYNNRYKKEVEEGTLKRQLMIEDGAKRGLKEEDVCRGSFVPTVRTPILNWLFFMLREDNIDLEEEEARKRYNQQYGHLQDDYDVEESEINQQVPEIDEFIYGNCTMEVFKKIKKLKSLSKSDNVNEAFIAYRMCVELCNRYNLDIDKIPTYN